MTNHPSDTPQIERPAAEFQGADDLVKLLPCPFCGGPVKLERAHIQRHEHYGERQFYGVVCRNTTNLGGTCCMEQVPSASKEAAIARWNMRAQNSTIEQQAKRIEELQKEVKTEQRLSFRDQVATLEAEVMEQARLNGMGSEREARLIAERNEAKSELLALHEILLCPGECQPIAECDTLTVRALKGYIAAADKVQMDRDEEIRISNLRGEKIEELLAQWSAACAEREELSAQIALAREALEVVINRFMPCRGDYIFSKRAALDKAQSVLSTLTTGNAVQAIEAREGEFEIWQDDMLVASSSGQRADAAREAMHYAAQYGQDGPVRVFEVTRAPITAEELRKLAEQKEKDS